MFGGQNTQGYTILEVMIFMAVSGFMFVLAATFISGKQSTTEFRQGMNSINTEVKQTINDVGNGFYPAGETIKCQSDNAGNPPTFTGTSAEQGGNQGCVFIGKILQFHVGTDPAKYNVFSIAGRQYVTDENSGSPNSFIQAKPQAITSPDLTENKTLEWGVEVTGMYNGNGPIASRQPIGAVGFFSSFNSSDQGGSQSVSAVVIPNAPIGTDTAGMISKINSSGMPAALDTSASNDTNIIVCFKGGRDRFGSLTIGGESGQHLSTNIKIDSSASAVGC